MMTIALRLLRRELLLLLNKKTFCRVVLVC